MPGEKVKVFDNIMHLLSGHDTNEIDGLNTRLQDNDELSVTDIAFVIDGG